jgi:hypothetical protein
MKHFGPQVSFFLLILAAAITLACGSSHPRVPSSVTVTPATADAQDFPDGAVQLTATGYFSTMPSPVSPLSVTWKACNSSAISVSTGGVARCNAGAVGTYSISAASYYHSNSQCQAMLACGSVGADCFAVYGVAQLTCP